MRKYLLASAAAVVLSTGALAADLPVRGPAIAPAPIFVAMNWTGFYVGAQVGGIQGRDRVNVVQIPAARQNYSDSAVIGGVYAGYNWQFNSLVVGLEADANLSGLSKTVTSIGALAFAPASVRARSSFEAGLVGKVGVAFDNALLYVLGGVSVADFNVRYANPGAATSIDNTRFGWTIGAGAAYKFTPNWSARAEYRYSDFGSSSHNPLLVAPFAGLTIRHKYATHRVMLGLTYQFGGPAGAVVAKY